MTTVTKSGRTIFIIIAIGIWAIVLQNAGIIPTNQNVYVDGGHVNVSGSVDIDNAIDLNGDVDVNIKAINGYENAFYKDTDGDSMLLPVINR